MKKQILSGSWSVRENVTNADIYPATVPGDIHNDLKNAGVIADPYYSDNSLKSAWVVERDWKYTKTFNFTKTTDTTYLVFDGIDTISDIYLNGAKLASTDNMFMQYRFDVTDKLVSGENTLEVVIHSIRDELKKHPEEGYFGCFNVQRIFVRKAQCHFGWDWAPNLPGTGIWRDVYLESTPDTYIDNIQIKTSNDGFVTFFINLPKYINRDIERTIELSVDDNTYSYKTSQANNFYSIKLDNPKLWWPRGYGEPNLYGYSVKLILDDNIIDEKQGRFGIRTVRLEEKPKFNPEGLTCQLYVNDTPVFLKGANWVPLDVMTGCVTEERYRKAITLAYEANFTMLRVWGGGIYENDTFFDICDEFGILTWQDFAYACADVPDNDFDFVNKAIEEAEYQVKRLRNHPSLVVYTGGNEKTGSYGLAKSLGDKLIYYYIRGVAEHLDGTRPYFPSSPWSHSDVGNYPSSGDTHSSSCGAAQGSEGGYASFRDILKTFDISLSSEIAVQGSPMVESLKRFIPENKLWPINDIYNLHYMRNPYDGKGGIWFPQIQMDIAEALFGKINSIDDFCKKTSSAQCELLRADLEYHKVNIGRCSATMTWMFDDIWPCGTWSCVDYYLQPKPSYYALKRSYRSANFIITKQKEGFGAFVVNDSNKEVKFTVEVGIMKDVSSSQIVKKQMSNIAKPYSSTLLYRFDGLDGIVLYAKGKIDGEQISTSLFTKNWKEISFTNPDFSTEFEHTNDGLQLTISSKSYVRYLGITSKEGTTFSDNYFDMLPNETKVITIKGSNLTPQDIKITTW